MSENYKTPRRIARELYDGRWENKTPTDIRIATAKRDATALVKQMNDEANDLENEIKIHSRKIRSSSGLGDEGLLRAFKHNFAIDEARRDHAIIRAGQQAVLDLIHVELDYLLPVLTISRSEETPTD